MPAEPSATPNEAPRSPPDQPAKPRGGTFRLSGDPNSDPRAAAQAHTIGLVANVHANGLHRKLGKRMVGVDYGQSSILYAQDTFARLAPSDPVAEMLIAQLIAAHTRAIHLADQAMAQTTAQGIRILNEYVDRAANTARRLALALAEYRRPPRTGTTNIGQANIAAKQVVVNAPGGATDGNATNEQGYGAQSGPQALPTLA